MAVIIGRGVLIFTIFISLAGLIWPIAAGASIAREDRKTRGAPPVFDARQVLVRLRAAVHTLFALLGFLVLWTVLDLSGRFSWTGSMTVLLLCALPLVHSVWPADCILHSAYTGWRGRPDTDTLAVTASLYFCFLPNAFRMGGLIETALLIVVSCSCSLLLAGIALYQFRREKRGVDSE